MPKIAYFTICSANYLAYALNLAHSLARAEPDYKLHVFLTDRLPVELSINLPELELTLIESLEIRGLADMAFRYSILEFNTAVKPYCFEHILGNMGFDAAIYLDPDILVVNPLEHVKSALEGGASCILTPHISHGLNDGKHPSEDTYLTCGVFNLGFAAFSNTPEALAFLRWWAGKTRRDCVVALERGIFTDQSYCNFAPCFIDAFVCLRHPGYNLAYWNLKQRTIELDGETLTADGEPVRFIHFSGIVPQSDSIFSRHQDRYTRSDIGALRSITNKYISDLRRLDVFPGGRFSDIPYAFGLLSNGSPITNAMRADYRNGAEKLPAEQDPFGVDLAQVDDLPPPASRRPRREEIIDQALTSSTFMLRNLVRRHLLGKERVRDYWSRRMYPSAARTSRRRVFTSGIDVFGYFRTESGLGQAARGFVGAIQAAKIPFNTKTLPLPDQFSNTIEFGDLAGAGTSQAVIIVANADAMSDLVRAIDPESLRDRYRIGHWTWELPVFPAAWASAFDSVDEIWVPSRFVGRAIQAATTKPLRIVPYVVQVEAVDWRAARHEFGLPTDAHVFLTTFDINSYAARKNPLGAIKAFCDAFPDPHAAAPRLLVKFHGRKGGGEIRAELLRASHADARITLLDGVYTPRQMASLRAACDTFVSLHRSEGFGLNIAEAMAANKLVIATDFSGNRDFLRPENGFPIPYAMRGLEAGEYPFGQGQWWAEPNHEAAVEAMRSAVAGGDAMQRLAARGREDIVAGYSPKTIGHVISEALAGRSGLALD